MCVEQEEREFGLQMLLVVEVFHPVPHSEGDEAYESDEHADVEAQVDLEAAMIVSRVPRL